MPSRHGPSRASSEDSELPLPLDLSHHFSAMTKNRAPSQMKQYYKYFQIPGAGNLAGGLPNVNFFPFDTLEAQAAKPERWPVFASPEDGPGIVAAQLASTSLSSGPQAASHIAVPKISTEADPVKHIDLSSVLQYGQAQGYPPLLSWIRQFAREHLHPYVPYRGGPEVTMTVGSTDGFSKAVELFYDTWFASRGDGVRDRPAILVEEFVYNSALNQATTRGVQAVPVKKDAGGALATGPGSLEDVLANWDYATGRRPNVYYTVTMGHNPTGYVLSLERRKEIYAVCSKYDVVIVEDDPYWYLQFPSAEAEEAKSRNQPVPVQAENTPVKSSGYPFLDSLAPSFLRIDVDGRVIRLDTFSKTVAPGCRLGFITAQPELIERLTRISEGGTSQPSGFVQGLIAELVIGAQPEAKAAFSLLRTRKEQTAFAGWKVDGWVRWLEGLRGMYEQRMNRMCAILDEGAFQIKAGTPARGGDADWGVVTKTRLLEFDWPRGGMFVWVRVHFEQHPLWRAARSDGEILTPVSLSTALMLYLTQKPHLVVAAVGLMFAATPEIREEKAWAYYRLCFAAESEENVDLCTRRFVAGVHKFWRIKDVRVIEDILSPIEAQTSDHVDADVGNLGMFLGC